MTRHNTRLHGVSISCAIVSIFVFLLLWQLLVVANVQRPLMFGNLPTPVHVAAAWVVLGSSSAYYEHVGFSCLRILIGILIALPLGVIFGLFIGLSTWCRRLLFPIFELLRPIPQITWIPVSILLFPSIEGSIIFITFMGGFFPILVNTIAGTQDVDETLVEAAKTMHASQWQLLRYVYFRSAVPSILTGLTVGVGTSWMSVIAAEMISGKYGIGYFTWQSYNLMNYADTIVGMITIGIVGIIFFAVIRAISRFVLAYRKEVAP